MQLRVFKRHLAGLVEIRGNVYVSPRGGRPKRRLFITLVGGAAAAWPVSAFAESERKLALIGYLSGASLSSTTSARMFLQGLQDLGYVEGRDLQITYRSSEGYQDRLPALAEELVQLKPDVIIGAGLDAVVALRSSDANDTHRLGDTRRCGDRTSIKEKEVGRDLRPASNRRDLFLTSGRATCCNSRIAFRS
jgi:hypothetical protein